MMSVFGRRSAVLAAVILAALMAAVVAADVPRASSKKPAARVLASDVAPVHAQDDSQDNAPAETAPAPPVVKHDLRYKLRAGEVVRWEIVHRAVVDTTIQGTNQTAETRSTSIKVWKVTDVDEEGAISFVHSVESIDMWQHMQGRQEVSYNSQTDTSVPPGYEDVAKAVGVPLTVITIDAHGTVLKREEKHPQPNASSTLLTLPLPGEPVAVGHAWSVPLDVEVILPGGVGKKIQTRQHFTLEKVDNGVATIQVESQVLTPIHDPAIEVQLVQRLTSGALRFDIEAGRVLSQQMDLDKRVIGFSGASSSMHYLTRFTEKLLSETKPSIARKPTPGISRKPQPVENKEPAPVDKKQPAESSSAALKRLAGIESQPPTTQQKEPVVGKRTPAKNAPAPRR